MYFGKNLYVLEGDVEGIKDHLIAHGAEQVGPYWRIPDAWFEKMRGTFSKCIPMPVNDSPDIPA